MDKETAIEISKKYLDFLRENNISVESAYLFGSYVKGNYHKDSDIDLALVFSELDNSFLKQVELMKLGSRIDTRIEPHPFARKNFNMVNPFANEIMNSGFQVL